MKNTADGVEIRETVRTFDLNIFRNGFPVSFSDGRVEEFVVIGEHEISDDICLSHITASAV